MRAARVRLCGDDIKKEAFLCIASSEKRERRDLLLRTISRIPFKPLSWEGEP